ncbi:TRAP transporter permease [Jannaschia sp. CCS1]|uniref:TRAP transporter permease n=1 Tax=Jannaschia sp. (strain CCS1) TaxID=290400 RepID=UPI000053AEF2|nr:TRAP transporter fused permease subunit [Jannaschia sp. CCS1]ABD54644.1 TRAP transporter 4TM/12TM fusion protein [Jannaschia sp. CCS1]
MTDQSAAKDQVEGPVIADGVDEEPVESNRRLFEGRSFLIVGILSVLYAGFHMAALNGLSLSSMTGIDLPFLPQFPMETWNFRIVHIAGALALGFMLFSAHTFGTDAGSDRSTKVISLIAALFALPALFAGVTVLGFIGQINGGQLPQMGGLTTWAAFPGTDIYNAEVYSFGIPLLVATGGAIVLGWFERQGRGSFAASDIVLALCALVVALYLIPIYSTAARNSVGTSFVPIGVAFAATAGAAMILELTRRVAGLALVIITGIFLIYTFTAHLLPGILAVQNPYDWQRFFGFVYTDAGILGPTTAVSSTYIILFIIFAAFLQASKVGDYFVNFAFAAAGRARGGPAKVAIFASGLMGMINGTSAGNVVATGSLTIPLMKKVGYHKKTAGAVEAAASTGGQIMPPIMGAGAFIMAEITGIPYQDIAIAALIPAVLYFTSIYFMVDFEAAKLGMRGMREDELPKFKEMARKVFLFLPIIILIFALFMGYSVIRAGTLATIAAVVVSWAVPEHFTPRGGWSIQRLFVLAITAMTIALTLVWIVTPAPAPGQPQPALITSLGTITGLIIVAAFVYISIVEFMKPDSAVGLGLRGLLHGLEIAGVMSIQIIAVCACAGIIVGVISLTGVGARFSAVLLDLAGVSQLLALFFAMCIAILLGMGMPTTAAYAVAASVVAPGLVSLGIPQLTAHFFVFYFAVVSAITPPVALASYAAAGISGANPMETSVASFKIGIAAFIVPFMFFYNGSLLMQGPIVEVAGEMVHEAPAWYDIARAGITAILGIFLLTSGIQGWFLGGRAVWFLRAGLIIAALLLIAGGIATDLAGVGLAVAIFLIQRLVRPAQGTSIPVRGAD